MNSAPAHPGLFPSPLRYEPVKGEWARLLAEVSGANAIERAAHVRPAPLGYYRLFIPEEGLKFGKVVLLADAPRFAAANQLARRLAQYGVPAINSMHGYKQFGANYALFLYDWVEGSFWAGREEEIEQLGKSVADMHCGLRRIVHDGSITTQAKSSKWDLLESLLESKMLEGEAAVILQHFMQRRSVVEELLASSCQIIHNDLHPGNVLFADGGVAAFLDFEEALVSAGNPLIDISWVLERFCFLRHELSNAERVASLFLSSYLSNAQPPTVEAGGIVDCILWRTFYALALLANTARPDIPSWISEWRKFLSILSAVSGWASVLESLECRFFRGGSS